MASIHPLAPSGSLLPPSGSKKPAAKGIPIAVPTTQRRMSAFSVKTANKALMTGYRDGGPHRRKSSASTQGHMSPPYSSKDDVELVGVLPGFESLVESEARRHRVKQKSVEPSNAKDVKEHKPAKRKRGSKELDSPELQPVGSVKARRHSTVAASSSGMGLHSVPSIVITPQSTMAPPKRIRKLSLAGNSITLPTRSILAGAQIPARIALTSVRIGGKAEFTAKGMSIVFGTDKITLNINGNSTRILHSQLLLVEYYTASQIRIIQIATKEKLPGTSILSEIYDPVHTSGKARKITLYSTEKESIILDNCSKLKNNGVDIDSLTDAAGEKLLALISAKSAQPCVQEKTEETLFMFPFKRNGKSKSIAVHAEDAQRLNEGQFLNDTLIEFGLKHIHSNLEVKNRALADQVFIFNTFFFQRLLTKPVKGPANSYDSVKNWTSKVDIFSMKYIIVPIHEKLHWHLAIIANPGLLLKDVGGSSSDDSESSSPEDKSSSHLEPESLSNSVIDVDTDMDVDVNKVKGRVDTEERPYIVCLDSLGKSHPSVFKVLRSYLEQELLAKKNINKALTAKHIPGKHTSNSPLQQNMCDCGVFLLHYVEVFLRHPVQVLDAIVNRTDDLPLWAATELETKRERYKDYVDSLTEKYKVFQFSQETINHFKEKRKSIDDATGGGGGGSGSGSDKGGEEQNDKVATTTTTISGDTKSPASGSSSSDLVAELSVGVSNN
ncbi:hypothetical protein CPB97_003997 [Podila verticillata]|nr:hypothetical protein CPB97_003997 [Podila verticillata]